MALTSPQYKIAEAIATSLKADAELTAQVPTTRWRLQKKAWHRTQQWESGAYVVPMRRMNPAHENKVLLFTMPILVAVVWPSDQDLVEDHETRAAVGHRIDMIFAWNGRVQSPAPLLALDNLYAGADKFNFQHTSIQPGDPFMEGAFQAGLDVVSTLVNVHITAPKRDSSTLGA